MNDWAKAIGFFNTHLRSTREQYFLYMNRKSNKLCVLDTYRNNLVRAGFLITVDRGMYKRIKKIPLGLSIKICLKLAKGEKIQNLENICKINVAYNNMVEEEKKIELKKNMMSNSFVANRRLESIND